VPEIENDFTLCSPRQRQVSMTGISEGRLGAGTPSGMGGGRWSAREWASGIREYGLRRRSNTELD